MLRTAQSKNLPNLLNFFSLLQSENLWDDLHDIKKLKNLINPYQTTDRAKLCRIYQSSHGNQVGNQTWFDGTMV